MQIGGITVSDGNTLDEQRDELMKEIVRLEKKALAETQPKK